MKKRVVITGTGCITPIGKTTKEFWENALAGKHGFGPITHFDKDLVKTSLVAQVKGFNAKETMGRKSVRRLDRYAQFAVHAAREAFADSGLSLSFSQGGPLISPSRIGVCLGTGVGGVSTYEEENDKCINKGSTFVNPLLMPKWIPNMAAANIAMDLGIQGPVHTISTACASGIDAIGHGLMLIESGRVDAVLAGGAEACITPLMISGFENMGALSGEKDADKCSRPFDTDRDGFVLGEGAAVLMLESLESAKLRKANIIAEVIGYGTSSDAYHLTAPEPNAEGLVLSIKQALIDANLRPSQIDYINAHGTSTRQNDEIEALGINKVFGSKARSIPVSSTKSLVGHLQGAAGALETLVCAMTLKMGRIHPTFGTKNVDKACQVNVVKDQFASKSIQYAMNLSLGFGGHNASLVLKKW
ncbi:beta-ketoacyl-ACP synthase II [Fusibacter sp. JL216-2]|uniref:beta-ketoacyl-ACP synthase II n=1 Tax=Fusibacter sp. JL216-2 TaxID=3071453 RepID=UPI003D3523BC